MPPPVHFANAHAFEKGDDVEIEWTNPAEEDIAFYEIERSGNGRNFHSIGRKQPEENNGHPASYSFSDEAPLHGPNFYRIAAHEKSGSAVYSQIMMVSPRDIHTGFNIYPNPVIGNQFSLAFSNMVPGDYSLELRSLEGRIVYHQLLNIAGATQSNLIVLPHPPVPGVYGLCIRNDQFERTQALIIQ